MNRIPLVSLALLAAPFAAAQDAAESMPEELQHAMARAEVHNKRVLVIGCAKDVDLQQQLKSAGALARKILYEFEVVQFAGGPHARRYSLDDGGAAMTLLTAGGEQLQRLPAADFVDGGKVAAAELLAEWQPHFCEPVDAQQKLDRALAVAKKTGRNVFVRFDAPW